MQQNNGSLGNQIGSQVGGMLGGLAEKAVKYISGFGEYKVEDNSILTGGMGPPLIVNSVMNGGYIVRHREYIADITATIVFTNNTYSINPALASTFPWLSQVAQCFEEYAIRGMVFEFKSMSANSAISASTNTALGTVIMATQYNSLNAPFSDKKTMENYEFANSAKPSESFYHPIECKMNQTPLSRMYTRSGPITTGDIRFYDLGLFQIATQGQIVAGGVMGELWCTFEIELFKPKLISAIGLDLLTDHWIITSVTSPALLSTAPLRALQPGSALNTIITGTSVSFPANITDGNYLFTYQLTGTSAVIVNPTLIATRCTFLTLWDNDTVALNSTPNGTTTTFYTASWVVQVTASNAYVTFGIAGTIPPGTADLFITQINGLILT
jgi:hypothetical protein